MDIQTRKIEFVQEFLKLQSDELVSVLKNIQKSETKENLKPMSMGEELNKRIDRSEKDFETGNYKSHEEVFAKYI
tara:strand:+ start:356 stop:580 length:225 start_codon:yes stop_codon:yes gene_type:complete